YHQSHECEDVGIDSGQGKPTDNGAEQNRTGTSESAGPSHIRSGDRMIGSWGEVNRDMHSVPDGPITDRRMTMILACQVVNRAQVQNFKLAFAVGSDHDGGVADLFVQQSAADGRRGRDFSSSHIRL